MLSTDKPFVLTKEYLLESNTNRPFPENVRRKTPKEIKAEREDTNKGQQNIDIADPIKATDQKIASGLTRLKQAIIGAFFIFSHTGDAPKPDIDILKANTVSTSDFYKSQMPEKTAVPTIKAETIKKMKAAAPYVPIVRPRPKNPEPQQEPANRMVHESAKAWKLESNRKALESKRKAIEEKRKNEHKKNEAAAKGDWKKKNAELAGITNYQKLKGAFREAEKETGIPMSFFAFTTPYEGTGYNPKATNSSTKACGLMQTKPDVFRYNYYTFLNNPKGLVKRVPYWALDGQRYSKKANIKKAGKNPRLAKKHFNYVAAGTTSKARKKNQRKLDMLCRTPSVNLRIAGHNIRVNMGNGFKSILKYREPKFSDTYFLQVLGGNGADPFLEAYADPKKWDDPVSKYVPKYKVDGNPSVFKKEVWDIKNGKKIRRLGHRELTVKETYDEAIRKVTYQSIPKKLYSDQLATIRALQGRKTARADFNHPQSGKRFGKHEFGQHNTFKGRNISYG